MSQTTTRRKLTIADLKRPATVEQKPVATPRLNQAAAPAPVPAVDAAANERASANRRHRRHLQNLRRAERRRIESEARAEEIAALLADLRTRYPAAFTDPPRPLAIGTGDHIRESGCDARLTSLAMDAWCKRLEYTSALAEGGPRYDLAGNPTGEVAAKDAEFARREIKRVLDGNQQHGGCQ